MFFYVKSKKKPLSDSQKEVFIENIYSATLLDDIYSSINSQTRGAGFINNAEPKLTIVPTSNHPELFSWINTLFATRLSMFP